MKKVTTSDLTLIGRLGEPPLPEPRRVQGRFLFVSEQTRVEAYKKLGELWLAEDFEEPCPVGSAPGVSCAVCGGTGVVRKEKP